MKAEERVARDADRLVMRREPDAAGNALRDRGLRAWVKSRGGEDAGGVDAHGIQVGYKAHDRADIEFRCR